MGLEISELCRKQLNTLTIGDGFGFLCCESLSVQLVSSYSEVLLGNPEHEDRTESDVYVHIYIYKHTCIHIALLCDTTEQNKRKGIREIKMKMISWSICSCSDHVYHSTVTYQCHALWWCPSQSFSFAAKYQLKRNYRSSKLRSRTWGALCIPSTRLLLVSNSTNSISWASSSNQIMSLLPVTKEMKLCSVACTEVLFPFWKTSLFKKALRNMLKITLCLHVTLNNKGLKHILRSFLVLGIWKYTGEPRRKGTCLSSCQVF